MNRTGLRAKISIKYVLPTCIWKYFWRISRYFVFLGISRKYLNFAGPRPREISEALFLEKSSRLLLAKEPTYFVDCRYLLKPLITLKQRYPHQLPPTNTSDYVTTSNKHWEFKNKRNKEKRLFLSFWLYFCSDYVVIILVTSIKFAIQVVGA